MTTVNVRKRQIAIETQGQDAFETQGQDAFVITPKPVLYFVAVSGNRCQRIASYSEADAREQAVKLLGKVSSFYQTFPVDVDYSAYPDVQAKKDLALGGFGGRAA